MDIGFSEEQELLRDTARRFLESECSTQFVRQRMAEPAAVTDAFWQKLAEQGWLGIVYPEDAGGSGLGLVDLVVLMEEMGRAVMPGPFFSTVLMGGLAIAEAGAPAQRRQWLPQIAAGEVKTALAWTEPNLRWDAAGIGMLARETGGSFALSGDKLFVGDAHLADILVVAARTRDGSVMEDGVSLFLVPNDTPGLTVTVLPTIDETRKLCEVRFDNVELPASAMLGAKHEGWAPLSRVIAGATVALAAEMCGGAQQVLDMTVAYAKIRIAFGKPIGSYQGVKHQAADMLVAIENAKSLTYYAAWAVDQGLDEAPLAVSMAKAAASDMVRKVTGTGIQLHGGIGMTWEHDLQLYFKRAKASEVAFGDATWHRARVAQLMGANLRSP
jgi:alkylation response protein AidB-like acyl-CoA dehydrogenase